MALPRLIKYERNLYRKKLASELGQWFDSPLGNSVLEIEKQILSHVLPTRFGYHLLYNGVGDAEQILETSPIRNKVCVSSNPSEQAFPVICSATTALPFENNSIDLVVLHHSLDYERSPHGVLREMSRVLIPGGSIVLIGFNPWSLWGGWKAVRFNTYYHDKVATAPWNTHFISPYRLTDWLALLEMEVEGCESGFYFPPIGGRLGKTLYNSDTRWGVNPYWFSRLRSNILAQRGAIYVMVAKKTTACITPVKPRLKFRRKSLIGVPAVNLKPVEKSFDEES